MEFFTYPLSELILNRVRKCTYENTGYRNLKYEAIMEIITNIHRYTLLKYTCANPGIHFLIIKPLTSFYLLYCSQSYVNTLFYK